MPPRLPFPFAPLSEFVSRRLPPFEAVTPGSSRHVATATNTTTRKVKRWRQQGLTLDEADAAAAALEQHPSAIWPDEWAEAEAEALEMEIAEPLQLPLDPERPCCTCDSCGPVDDRGNNGCSQWCWPCTFGVCGCPRVPPPGSSRPAIESTAPRAVPPCSVAGQGQLGQSVGKHAAGLPS